MFELVAAGIGAGNAVAIINAIDNGMNIVTALSMFAGVAGAGAFVLANGLKWITKWAGKQTIINY
ncbi:hypothetical protein ERICIV_00826 [Paenibacillus larvae subsp. larvae]|uniref:Bacteriocin n=1 Tax=Paenibacillus larvae subsp. larvae TaxID=147375 RepID=A0A2L1UA28_9BACL|nr:hypothetical protein [Paenibacillus larvae]AQT85634.1 hypothetical protein B1222_16480 [Paenibacillus larvae subsp. pulvifaciens]AQZ47648.1 hypothetical protein B5S25_14760 [Paenibacillus larvae subsp. pulvifaciens]AVF25030.1 hypothetical protein ERICIII_00823 [Paenibacillus larvae subsp. larvae]AVF29794.1 hypothetical protein ERICIV_00826 [Paenibacillus larvae subsp. larvae]MBH0343606.1 hypothetical protein [Paenibacillus larvae]